MKSKSKVAGIILAAGEAKRMGRSKLRLPYGSGTILDAVIGAARRSPLAPIIVVLGHKAAAIRATVNLEGLAVVDNPRYRQGQSTSLQTGLTRVPDTCQGAMFLLGDQPRITPSLIGKLVDSFDSRRDRLVIPRHQGRRGNPVIAHRELFPRISKLTGDTGARPLFREFSDHIRWVESADGSLFFDVDTPGDYKTLLTSPAQAD